MRSIHKLPLAICLMGLALNVHVSLSQNSPQDYIDAHNAARAEVGSIPLIWNDTLAKLAYNRSIEKMDNCNLVKTFSGSYEENIAEATYPIAGVEAVKLWANEKLYYDYDSNECVGRNCLHYTQVVWNKTTDVGCVRAQCNSGFWFVYCVYYPAGNIVLQRPYIRH